MQATSLRQLRAFLLRCLFLTALMLNSLRNVSFHEGIAQKDNTAKAEKFTFTHSLNKFTVPGWMDDVFKAQPVENHSKIFEDPHSKYIVLACHYYNCWKSQDACVSEACGGITDRMWQIPYYLWLAHQTGRYFLIRFSNPHPLEKFYLPPKNGFDWRLPTGTFIDDEFERHGNRSFTEMRNQRRMQWHQHIYKDQWKNQRVIFANTNLAPLDTVKVAGFKGTGVIPGMFRRMFEPIPSISKKINDIANEYSLAPGNYAGVHIRARFPVSNQAKPKTRKRNVDMSGGGFLMEDQDTFNLIANIANNAINCAMQIMPDAPSVYVASDSVEPIEYIAHRSLWQHNSTKEVLPGNYSHPSKIPKIASRKDSHIEPKHFNFQEGSVEEFSTVFVDQWILGHARCISHGAGGFGMFVSALTGNYDSCRICHRETHGDLKVCPDYFQLGESQLTDYNASKGKRHNMSI